MIGLDTNVVLRYLLQDDAVQTMAAKRLFAQCATPEGDPCFISLGTMLEIVWVLRSRYRFPIGKVSDALQMLLLSEGLVVQNEREVFAAMIEMDEGKGSFEHALIGALGQWMGCRTTLTFDKKALKLPGFEPA